MKKWLISIAFAIVFFVGYESKMHAYEGGYLDGKPMLLGSRLEDAVPTYKATDGDPNTKVTYYDGSYMWYIFDSPVNIKTVRMDYEYAVPVTFFDSNDKVLHNIGSNTLPRNDYAKLTVNGVKKIQIVFSQTFAVVYDFDVFGNDFVPPSAAPTVLTAEAGEAEVKLKWNAVLGPEVVGYIVYQDGVRITPTPITDTKYTVLGLNNGTTYHFQVTTKNTFGLESVKSNTASATPFDLPPAAPANFRAMPGDTVVDLSWSANTEADFLGYIVYQDGVRITPSLITEISLHISGLTNKKTYRYDILAVDQGGNESEISTTYAMPDDPPPPSAPIGLKGLPGNTEVILSWAKNPEPNITGYNVYKDGQKINSSLSTNLEYTVSNLTNQTDYTFRVSAVNTRNQESALSVQIKATPAGIPKQPQNLKGQAANGQVTLNWNVVSQPVTKYIIYRDGEPIGEAAAPPFVDESVQNEQKYKYQVSAVNDFGESAKSNEISTTPSEKITSFENVVLPFSIGGLLASAVGFLKLYGAWILLALAIIFSPVLYGLVQRLISPKETAKEKRQDTRIDRIYDRLMKEGREKEAREITERLTKTMKEQNRKADELRERVGGPERSPKAWDDWHKQRHSSLNRVEREIREQYQSSRSGRVGRRGSGGRKGRRQ